MVASHSKPWYLSIVMSATVDPGGECLHATGMKATMQDDTDTLQALRTRGGNQGLGDPIQVYTAVVRQIGVRGCGMK